MSKYTPESTIPEQLPEGLDEYPAFGTAVADYDQQFADYLVKLNGIADTESPAGYNRAEEPAVPESGAASPTLAVAVLLKRLGAPIAIVDIEYDEESGQYYEVHLDPEIEPAYDRLWSEIFGGDARMLANSIARASINRYEALPIGFQVAPIVNSYILWAHSQKILERSFVTAKISLYMDRGADPHTLCSVASEVELAEALIADKDVRPLALETVLAMGSIDAIAALTKDHKLAEELHIDLESLPTVDESKIEFAHDDFLRAYDNYWKPVFDSIKENE